MTAHDLANRFVQKMKTRDMRVDIRDDFSSEDLSFDCNLMLDIIRDEQLPLDFVYDTMVGLRDKRDGALRIQAYG